MNIVVCVKAVPSSTEVKMDPQTNTMSVESGDYEIFYGNSSDTPAENRVTLKLL